MIRIPTQIKVASGYLILVVLLFVTVRYIYGEMLAVTQTGNNMDEMNRRWTATYDVSDKLYSLEIAEQPMKAGLDGYTRQYEQARREALLSIDSLQTILEDSVQRARLDTMRLLLNEKDRQLRDVNGLVRKAQSNYAYQRQINRLIANQDTIITRPKTYRDTITQTHSYAVRKKEGFFRRLRNVFVPSKADSTHVSQITTRVSVDSTEKAYNPADTVVTMLREVQHKAEDTRHGDIRRLDSRIMTLLARGKELNERLNALMKTLESDERAIIARHQKEQKDIEKNSARTISAIAVAAVLLAVFFLIIIWRDIMKSNHYRKELEKAKQRAENLLEQREQLMLTITHDIKAPVGSLIGYADLLKSEDSRQQTYIDSMKASAGHLLDMVTALLDYHRLDANKMEVSKRVFRPHELFADIHNCFVPLAAGKGLRFDYDCTIDSEKVFVGDPSRIRQIAENLLSNALKFTDSGKVSLSVSVSDSVLNFSVGDTGCGISPDDMARMFNEFTRLSNAQGQEGFGLGLSITRKMADLLGGSIDVDSKPGEGTIFKVALPLDEEVAEAVAGDYRRLLIIDDDRLQLRLTAEMLAAKGIESVCCLHPEEALTALSADRFDAVLTDIQMPAMNGFDLVRRIRQLPDSRSSLVPVIAVTARSDMNAELLRPYGFSTCLHKPYTAADLLSAINGVESADGVEMPVGDVEMYSSKVSSGDSQQCDRLRFDAITAFAGDDVEAARDIIRTFIEETRKSISVMKEASENRDAETVSAVAHKMLPLFMQINADKCAAALGWLEAQRGRNDYSDEFRHNVTVAISEAERVVAAACKL